MIHKHSLQTLLFESVRQVLDVLFPLQQYALAFAVIFLKHLGPICENDGGAANSVHYSFYSVCSLRGDVDITITKDLFQGYSICQSK